MDRLRPDSSQAGNFADVWKAHEQQVRRYLLRRGVTRHLLEDVLQEAAIKAFLGWSTFQGRCHPSTWLNTVAYNEAISAAKRAKKEKTEAMRDDYFGETIRPSSHVLSLDYVPAVSRANDTGFLDDDEALILRLRFETPSVGWKTIALQSGKSDNYCAKIHCRGLAKFRTYLFLHEPHVYARAELLKAFERACQSPDEPLTLAEQNAFRHIVIERSISPSIHGYWTNLHKACTKVANCLKPRNALEENGMTEPVELEHRLADGRKATIVRVAGVAALEVSGVSSTTACLQLLGVKPSASRTTQHLNWGEIIQSLNSAGLTVTPQSAQSLQDLSHTVRMGSGTLLLVNAGMLWRDAGSADFGEPNHCIVVQAIAEHPDTSELLGAWACDPSEYGIPFISADLLVNSWLTIGGKMCAIQIPGCFEKKIGG